MSTSNSDTVGQHCCPEKNKRSISRELRRSVPDLVYQYLQQEGRERMIITSSMIAERFDLGRRNRPITTALIKLHEKQKASRHTPEDPILVRQIIQKQITVEGFARYEFLVSVP
jgi:hypothetical protein